MATATCPAGHESTTTDYCDTCGAPIGAATAGEAPASAAAPAAEPSAPAATPCPGCGEPVLGRFCESCGYNIEAGTPPAPATVSLTLGADRDHWERMSNSGEPPFPAEVPSLTFVLTGDRVTLGRVHASATPDVDLALSGAAADPGVSHHQCEFVRDEGGWTVRDTDSANGTWVNDATEPLPAGESHPLLTGDRIFVGAWTRFTVLVEAPAGAPTTPDPEPVPAPSASPAPSPDPGADPGPDPGPSAVTSPDPAPAPAPAAAPDPSAPTSTS
jgi:hypothetical protein